MLKSQNKVILPTEEVNVLILGAVQGEKNIITIVEEIMKKNKQESRLEKGSTFIKKINGMKDIIVE